MSVIDLFYNSFITIFTEHREQFCRNVLEPCYIFVIEQLLNVLTAGFYF